MDSTPTVKTVRLELFQGDVRERQGCGALIMGPRNPLKGWIEATVAGTFRAYRLPGSRDVHGEYLASRGSTPFRSACTLNVRIRSHGSLRPAEDLATLIAYLSLMNQATHFTLLPLTHRHPRRTAECMLQALWLLAYFSREWLRTDDVGMRFTIASLDGVDVVKDLLANDAQGVWESVRPLHPMGDHQDSALSVLWPAFQRKRVRFLVVTTP